MGTGLVLWGKEKYLKNIAALEGNLNVCFLIIASFPIGIASYFHLLRLFQRYCVVFQLIASFLTVIASFYI